MEVALTRSQQTAIAIDVSGAVFAATDKMWLTVSSFTPSRTSTDADFIAAEVPNADIPAQTLANGFISGVNLAGDGLLISLDLAAFTPSVATNLPIAVGGFVIMDSTNTTAKAYGTFDTPYTFDSLGDALVVKSNFTIATTGNEDAEFVDAP